MHRFVVDCPLGKVVDHINGNGLDNRRENLRICSVAQNNANIRKAKSKSGFRGVRLENKAGLSKPWIVSIRNQHGGRIYGGNFKTAEEAARRYDELAKQFFGEFAKLNFPEQLNERLSNEK